MKKAIFLFLAIIFIAGCLNITPPQDDNGDDDGNYDLLAQCLTEKGVKMYGAEWCGHCQNQKKAFGSSFQYVNYVDCDKDRDACVEAGVQGYPTWVIDGQSYPGEQDLSDLAAISGCSLAVF